MDQSPHQTPTTLDAKLDELLRGQRAIREELEALAQAVAAPATRYLSIPHAAAYCDTGEDSIRRMLSEGTLTKRYPRGGAVRIDREELDAVILGSTAPPTGCGRGMAPRVRDQGNGRYSSGGEPRPLENSDFAAALAAQPGAENLEREVQLLVKLQLDTFQKSGLFPSTADFYARMAVDHGLQNELRNHVAAVLAQKVEGKIIKGPGQAFTDRMRRTLKRLGLPATETEWKKTGGG